MRRQRLFFYVKVKRGRKGERVKKITIFIVLVLSMVSIQAAGKEIDGYMLDYEINSMTIHQGYLDIRGWAYVWNYQGFYQQMTADQGSHRFQLRIGQKEYSSLHDYSVDLSYLNASSQLSACSKQQNDQKGMSGKCNYALQDIGFHFKVPLSDIQHQSSVTFPLILKMTMKDGHIFEGAMHYFGSLNKVTSGDIEIYFSHSLENARFKIDTSIDAFVKTGPTFASERATWQGNYLYLEKGTVFSHILDKKIDQHVTMYQVAYEPSHDVRGRLRVKEKVGGNNYAWIPSAYVQYDTQDFMITLNHRPIIDMQDLTVSLNQAIDPYEDVYAYDQEDGNLVNQLSIQGTYDTSKEGDYTLYYQVSDHLGFTCAKKRIIHVKNQEPFLEAKNRYFFLGEDISIAEYLRKVTAHDQEDGDLMEKVKVDYSCVDVYEVGHYPVYYEVADSGNKKTRATAIVTIMDPFALLPLKNYVRFIRVDTLNTLEDSSTWRQQGDYHYLQERLMLQEPIIIYERTI